MWRCIHLRVRSLARFRGSAVTGADVMRVVEERVAKLGPHLDGEKPADEQKAASQSAAATLAELELAALAEEVRG